MFLLIITKTLAEFITYFGEDRQICVSRELSKLHEENVRGTVKVLTHFEKTAPRGEIVVVVGGKPIVKEVKKKVNSRRRITHNNKNHHHRWVYRV
jgi:16S rRNA (cytidine1402-2'-O)-methyltransferase